MTRLTDEDSTWIAEQQVQHAERDRRDAARLDDMLRRAGAATTVPELGGVLVDLLAMVRAELLGDVADEARALDEADAEESKSSRSSG